MSKLAIVQAPPVLLDRQQTLQRAVDYIEEAAGKGAELVVFPEAFVPGYPAWIWRLRPDSMSQDQLGLWESRVDSLKAVLETPAAALASDAARKLLIDNQHGSIRYSAKILSWSGQRDQAIKVLVREFWECPSLKTLMLLTLVALGISYRKQDQSGEDWRGSIIK